MTTGEQNGIKRAIVEALRAGWSPVCVFDGEEMQYGKQVHMTSAEVIAACESVDDSHIHFKHAATNRRAWARIILGNASDGSEVIADNAGVLDFDRAMSHAMGC